MTSININIDVGQLIMWLEHYSQRSQLGHTGLGRGYVEHINYVNAMSRNQNRIIAFDIAES